MTRTPICLTSDIPSNGMKECEAGGGLKLLIANSGDDYFAYQAVCPHQDVPLCEGLYDGSVLTCHQHLWQWDIRTGAAIGLAEAPLGFYEVKVEDGKVYVLAPSVLKLAALFAGLSEATLAELERIAVRETVTAGVALYRIGDPTEDIYVLVSGRVNFVIGREERTTAAGFALKKGEVFGWNALLDQYPHRIAAATCLEESTLLRINGRQMIRVLEADPAGGFLVMRRLSSQINRYLVTSGAK